MNVRDILTIYDYNYWATNRILTASQPLNPKQFTTPTLHSFGSLRGTLTHILDAECAWRMLCQHNTLTYFNALREENFPSFGSLARHWNEEEHLMRAYLSTLSDDDLSRVIRYTTDEGDKRERVLWHCLLHVVNHGTHHRSEVAEILTEYDHSPGELDFTVFLNEQRGSM